MSRVFVQIHLALGNWKNQTGSQPFGISFPQYEEKAWAQKSGYLQKAESSWKNWTWKDSWKDLRIMFT